MIKPIMVEKKKNYAYGCPFCDWKFEHHDNPMKKGDTPAKRADRRETEFRKHLAQRHSDKKLS